MEASDIADICTQALWVLLTVSMPIMLIALVVGLMVALFQALTQIQEMTLTFVPKILAIFIALMILGPFMFTTIKDFSDTLVTRIIQTN